MSDLIELRRNIYEVSRPESEWILEVCRALISSMALPMGVYARRVGRDPGTSEAAVFGIGLPFDPQELERLAAASELYRERPGVMTVREMLASRPTPGELRPFMARHQVADAILLTAGDPHTRLLLVAPNSTQIEMCCPARDAWYRIAVHLAAAMRLRGPSNRECAHRLCACADAPRRRHAGSWARGCTPAEDQRAAGYDSRVGSHPGGARGGRGGWRLIDRGRVSSTKWPCVQPLVRPPAIALPAAGSGA